MPLSAATRLGPYEILSPAGAGGMGEVYKARDTRLDRTVAIKILPAHVTRREELRQRFEREARAVSSLNHPNICTLYDIGQHDGIDFLVMEYLEGETLEERLKKGPLVLSQFFEIAIQVGDALDTAHQHGVVHRDLKPANIMLTRTGAKLLDFGLAKMKEAADQPDSLTSLPTQTRALTEVGTILGTWQYMAPEQLEGLEADARTDIFAFGVVLYEMATGRKAFSGRSRATLISSIMTAEPAPLVASAPGPEGAPPAALDHLIRRCLAKDAADRWQTVHDLLLELKWVAQAGSQAGIPAPVTARRKRRERAMWALLAALVLVAVAEGAAMFLRPRPQPAHVMRFSISPPPKIVFDSYDTLAVSPDGQRLVFTGVSAGKRSLWYRPLDTLNVEMLRGTEDAEYPFWSPDSRSVGFYADHKLKKIDVTGAPPQTICDLAVSYSSGSWSRDGTILFMGTGYRLHRVPSAGGEPKPVLELDSARQERRQFWPEFLPDGRHFLYLSVSRESAKTGIRLGVLDSNQTTHLFYSSRRAAFMEPGYLLFERQGTLLAQPFDAGKLQLAGESTPLATLGADSTLTLSSDFSVSSSGILVYRNSGAGDAQLTWHNRDGKRTGTLGDRGMFRNMTMSPDEKRLALDRTDSGLGTSDIWVMELSSGILTRMTFDPGSETDPAWSPDSRQIAYRFSAQGKSGIARKNVGSGPEEVLFETKDLIFPQDWVKDGSALLCINFSGKSLYRLPLSGQRKLETLLDTPFDKDEPHLSPDGRWIAYNSIESGRWEVYVAAFPSFTEKRQVSNGGGCQPLWRKDQKELYYLTLDGALVAMDVKTGAAVETGPPKTLFQTALNVNPIYDQYRVTGDGQRFIVAAPVDEGPRPFTVVLNAAASIRR